MEKNRWIPIILLSVTGFVLSFHLTILSVSLLYALPLVTPLLGVSVNRLVQTSPIILLLLLSRFIPFFIGAIMARGKNTASLLIIALSGALYEMLRAVVHYMSWGYRLPELKILIFQDDRLYTYLFTQVRPEVLQRLYPLPPRILGAAVLAVLGAMVVRWSSKRSKQAIWYQAGFLLLALVVIIMAT